jgi:hypothetical protein
LTGATGARRNPLFIKGFFLTFLIGLPSGGQPNGRNPLFIKGFFLTAYAADAAAYAASQSFIDQGFSSARNKRV